MLWVFLKKGPGGGEKRARKDGSDITALYLLFSTSGGSCMPLSLLKMAREGGRGGISSGISRSVLSPSSSPAFQEDSWRERVRNEAVMNKFRIQIAKLKRER